jgi:hypothetical protein
MRKAIASIISVGSILFGLYTILKYGTSQGGEGAITILGLWGMPLTLLVESFSFIFKSDWLNPWGYYFFYFLQYQLLSLIILKFPSKK